MPSIISAKFIGGIGFYDPVWSQHQNPVKLLVDMHPMQAALTLSQLLKFNCFAQCTMPFSFLSLKTANLEIEGQIIVTQHKDVLCTQPRNTTGLAPCTHEEADVLTCLRCCQPWLWQGNDNDRSILLILMC